MFILEIFQYQFMVKALILGLVLSVLFASIGQTVVLKRLSMVGDALSHASLVGVACGLLLNFNPILGAMLATILSAFAIEVLRKYFLKYSEISISILLAGAIGLAGNLSAFIKNGVSFDSFLFGSIVTISDFEFWFVLGISIVVLILLFLFQKELFFLAFDEEAARLAGVPSLFVNALFTFVTALTIAVAARTVGSLIVSSLLVLPVAASLQLAKSYKHSVFLSILFSLCSTLIGLLLSFYTPLKPGATLVLIATLFVLLALGLKAFQKTQRTKK